MAPRLALVAPYRLLAPRRRSSSRRRRSRDAALLDALPAFLSAARSSGFDAVEISLDDLVLQGDGAASADAIRSSGLELHVDIVQVRKIFRMACCCSELVASKEMGFLEG